MDSNLTPRHQCYEFAPTSVRSTAFLQWQPRRPPDEQFSRDFPELTPKTSHGWVSNPHHDRANFLPAQNRVNRRISIYLSTCAGSLPGDCISAQVGLDTNRSSGPFRSAVITEWVLSPDLAGSDSI